MYSKIAVFDSGCGGLAIAKALASKKVASKIIYYADNKNVPYGNKNADEILKIGQDALDYLNNLDCDLIVLACNTISSILPKLHSKTKVLAVSEYAKKALTDAKSKTLILATKATLSTNIYQNTCKNLHLDADFIAPIEFVNIVENSKFQDAKRYFDEYFKGTEYSHILLGCTHYPFLLDELKSYFTNSIFLDPAKYLAADFAEGKGECEISFKASKDVKILREFYERIKNV